MLKFSLWKVIFCLVVSGLLLMGCSSSTVEPTAVPRTVVSELLLPTSTPTYTPTTIVPTELPTIDFVKATPVPAQPTATPSPVPIVNTPTVVPTKAGDITKGQIKGLVIDASTRQPLSGWTVIPMKPTDPPAPGIDTSKIPDLSGIGITTSTDSSGAFLISALPPGKYFVGIKQGGDLWFLKTSNGDNMITQVNAGQTVDLGTVPINRTKR